MAYSIDNQTYSDLNITGRYKQNSVFSIYNKTITNGASQLLEKLFIEPMTDADSINTRRDVLHALSSYTKTVNFTSKEHIASIDYLGSTTLGNPILAFADILRLRLSNLMVSGADYGILVDGMIAINLYLKKVKPFLLDIQKVVKSTAWENKIQKGIDLLNKKSLANFIDADISDNMSIFTLSTYNYLLRSTLATELRQFLKLVEEIDCYLTVARIGRERNFVYADALAQEKMLIDMKNVYHPGVKGAIGNDIQMNHDSNVIFLTGANMAGKSTLMKSFSICLYLAHLGFPIPADGMQFTPIEGMFTSINVPDDITQGYSHFYAEVMRVKKVAQEVAQKKRLLIIFDELFKGTNVKDAYDGTLEITRAFSKCEKSIFVISTHIMEAGQSLEKECKNIQFKYLPTLLVDDKPQYPYKLADGIADDRHGMKIITNERIIDIINSAK